MPRREPWRILVVDDEQPIREAIRDTLRTRDFTCALAADGQQALGMMANQRFDLLITDLRMPGVHGQALITRVLEESWDTAIIAMTGIADARLAATLLELGADDFIFKPFDAVLLLARVRRVLQTLDRVRMLRTNDGAIAAQLNLLLERPEAATDAPVQPATAEGNELRDWVHTMMRLATPNTTFSARRAALAEDFATSLGEAVGADADLVHDLKLAALAQNIGEVDLPAEVVQCPDAERDATQRALYEAHVVLGLGLLPETPGSERVRRIVRQHHEHFDGSGYPEGLAGTAICIGARILRLVDAMTTFLADTPLPAEHMDSIKQALVDGAGSAFDPELVPLAIQVLEAYELRLSSCTKQALSIDGLREGDILAEDLRSTAGHVLVGVGHPLGQPDLCRLARHHGIGLVADRVTVLRGAGAPCPCP